MVAPFSDPVMYALRNELGRDFVVGDIHGAFDFVLKAMDSVNFDQSCDRIFAVGDLIDRGPDSARSARFLSHDWVRSIRGNHEDMLLEMHKDGDPPQGMIDFGVSHNGLGWWLTTPDSVRQDIIDAITPLPLVIELPTDRGTVGMVHADVPFGMDWQTFTGALVSGDEKVADVALWGRDRVLSGDERGVHGIGRVFVGHTPLRRLTKLGNIFAIDTGAVYHALDIERQGALTFVEVMTQTNTLKTLQPMARSPVAVATWDRDERPFTALTSSQAGSS